MLNVIAAIFHVWPARMFYIVLTVCQSLHNHCLILSRHYKKLKGVLVINAIATVHHFCHANPLNNIKTVFNFYIPEFKYYLYSIYLFSYIADLYYRNTTFTICLQALTIIIFYFYIPQSLMGSRKGHFWPVANFIKIVTICYLLRGHVTKNIFSCYDLLQFVRICYLNASVDLKSLFSDTPQD